MVQPQAQFTERLTLRRRYVPRRDVLFDGSNYIICKRYSMTETAKANGLKVYDYLKYVMEEMLEHEGEITEEYLKTIVPWSDSLPESLKVNTVKK